jgi:autonomous glycyl radical cofactor GrcA
MKLYRDANLTQEITDNEIDLGRAEVGKETFYEFYLYNDEASSIEAIKIQLENVVDKEEIRMINYPTELGKKEFKPIKFSWTPTLKLKQGLKLRINISAREIYS